MESRRDNWIVAGLVSAGVLLMGTLIAHGFRRPAAESSPSAPGAAVAQIERRRVPGLSADEIRRAGLNLKEAMYYEKLPGGKVQCTLCPFMCVLGDGERDRR